jgi:hypothetical protein
MGGFSIAEERLATLNARVELMEVFNQKDFVFLMPYYTLVKRGAPTATFGEVTDEVWEAMGVLKDFGGGVKTVLETQLPPKTQEMQDTTRVTNQWINWQWSWHGDDSVAGASRYTNHK